MIESGGEERYQAVVAALDAIGGEVCVTDAHGRLLYQNAALRRELAEQRGSCALEQAMVDARQAALARTVADGRVTVHVRTEAAEYEVRAVAATMAVAGGERMVVTTVRERSARRMTPGSLRAVYGLTARETRVAALLDGGVRTREIAQSLGISVHTARRHVESVLRKLGVHSRGEVRQRLSE